ncbi:MAG TPA: sugar transferase, partial [Terriglobales bacterium]|nr:sugar transferase [Terriglobales bacterium]
MRHSNCNSARAKTVEDGRSSGGHPAFGLRVRAKRLYDLFFSVCGFVLLTPLFLVIAALVKIADGGPILYRQIRVGRGGRTFQICKFRTMVPRADETGPSVTRDGDARITWIGRILRKTKLDELPQLWNVLKGDMSLVGPRPEVPKYVRQYTPEQRIILSYTPGITDLASVHFRNEEMLLRNVDRLEEFYFQHCLPKKLKLNLDYAERANVLSDTWLILQTVCPYWICVLPIYGVILAASFWLSCQLVYDFAVPPHLRQLLFTQMFAIVALQLGSLIWRKQCKGLLSYFSIPELRQVAAALGFACLLLLGLWGLTGRGWPPRNTIIVDLLLSLCMLSGFRLLLRLWRERSSVEEDAGASCPARVGIIGAGLVGTTLAQEFANRRELGLQAVAFFDDDHLKWGRRIQNVPVAGAPELLLDDK